MWAKFFQMYKLDIKKAEEPEIKFPASVGSQKNCGKLFKRWEYQTTLPVSRKTCMQVKNPQLKPDMEQQTGSKLGKEYVKVIYCMLI